MSSCLVSREVSCTDAVATTDEGSCGGANGGNAGLAGAAWAGAALRARQARRTGPGRRGARGPAALGGRAGSANRRLRATPWARAGSANRACELPLGAVDQLVLDRVERGLGPRR